MLEMLLHRPTTSPVVPVTVDLCCPRCDYPIYGSREVIIPKCEPPKETHCSVCKSWLVRVGTSEVGYCFISPSGL